MMHGEISKNASDNEPDASETHSSFHHQYKVGPYRSARTRPLPVERQRANE